MGFFDTISPRVVGDLDAYKEAQHFAGSISPLAETDYLWAYKYSSDLYEKYLSIYKILDEKADGIIKYLGGSAGIFTLAVILNITSKNSHIVAWALPSFMASLLSVLFAIAVRQPLSTSLPPSPEKAFDYANRYGDAISAQGAFVGEWQIACEGIRLRIEIKSKWVKWATWMFYSAIVLLIFPLLAAISNPPLPVGR